MPTSAYFPGTYFAPRYMTASYFPNTNSTEQPPSPPAPPAKTARKRIGFGFGE